MFTSISIICFKSKINVSHAFIQCCLFTLKTLISTRTLSQITEEYPLFHTIKLSTDGWTDRVTRFTISNQLSRLTWQCLRSQLNQIQTYHQTQLQIQYSRKDTKLKMNYCPLSAALNCKVKTPHVPLSIFLRLKHYLERIQQGHKKT